MTTSIDQGFSENILLAARVARLLVVTGSRKDDVLMGNNGPKMISSVLWDTLKTHLSCRALIEFSQTESLLQIRKLDDSYTVSLAGTSLSREQGSAINKEQICRQLGQIALQHTQSSTNVAIDNHICLLIDAEFLFEEPEHPREIEHQMSMFLAEHARTAVLKPGGVIVVLLASNPSKIPVALQNMAQVRSIGIPPTSRDERLAFCNIRAMELAKKCNVPLETVSLHITKHTDDMRLNDINKIIQIASHQNITSITGLTETIRGYQNGIAHSPWASPQLREHIARAKEILTQRVKGQPVAVLKVASALKRAAVGLSSTTEGGTRGPRSVLFLSGATGTGKTEMVKALAELLFGDESAIIRFDCGEMKEAHSVSRLIGAPPGYVGYDAGGLLITRLQERPQSIVLMDEIEKAHPSLWDLFLGILEDGRVTSGNGQLALFGEAILVFTSNMGIYEDVIGQENFMRRARFGLDTPYSDIADGVRVSMNDYFTNQLGRSEIWGRIGDKNLIVFDFIRDPAGITQKFIDLRVQSARRQYAIDVQVAPAVVKHITNLASSKPEVLTYGARGLREQIAQSFFDPLDEFIFDEKCDHCTIAVKLDANQNVCFHRSP